MILSILLMLNSIYFFFSIGLFYVIYLFVDILEDDDFVVVGGGFCQVIVLSEQWQFECFGEGDVVCVVCGYFIVKGLDVWDQLLQWMLCDLKVFEGIECFLCDMGGKL